MSNIFKRKPKVSQAEIDKAAETAFIDEYKLLVAKHSYCLGAKLSMSPTAIVAELVLVKGKAEDLK